MTIVPLTQASSRLGIDAKTLRRWLTQAQLPLSPDPQDARKKGVHAEHLHLLAQQHQRSLAPLSSSPSAQVAASPSPLPAALLALPEQLSALQAQVAALQQQMASLASLLKPCPAELAAPAAQPSKTPLRSPKAPLTPKARRAAKVASKPLPVIPRVEYGGDGHYAVICPKQGRLPFEPDTPQWFVWVATQSSFRFVGKGGSFSAHHEWRIPKGSWRAHRHIRNHSYTLRLAPNHELTIAVLQQAAEALQAHLM